MMIDTSFLGKSVNGLHFDVKGEEFSPVSGKLSGVFCDSRGRVFAQIKRDEDPAVNVDIFTINATTADRELYMEMVRKIVELEKEGNALIEQKQREIVENSNAEIDKIYELMTPFIDFSSDE